MDTRRTRAANEARNAASKEMDNKPITLRRGNLESTSDKESASSETSRGTRSSIGVRVLRSKGRNARKDNESQRTPEKHVEENSVSVSPPVKRRRQTDEDPLEAPKFIDLSDDEELGADDNLQEGDLDSSAEDPLSLKPSSDDEGSEKATEGLKKILASDSKKSQNLPKPIPIKVIKNATKVTRQVPVGADGTTKPLTIHVKKVIKGLNDGELHVVTSYEDNQGDKSGQKTEAVSKGGQDKKPETTYRTYSGPLKKVTPSSIPISGGRKYMILDKATIKGMMEKGLIQAVGREGGNQQQPVSYRAILPKTVPSILRRLNSTPFATSVQNVRKPGPQDISTSQNVATAKQSSSVMSSPPSSTSVKEITSSGSIIHIPPDAVSTQGTSGSIPQVITAPVFVKSQGAGPSSNSGNVQVVTLPPSFLNQIQKGGSLLSVAMTNNSTSGKSLLQPSLSVQGLKNLTKNNVLASSSSKASDMELMEDPDDPDFCPSADGSDESGEEEGATEDSKYGVPTGVCKVLKSMKMYQYIDKPQDRSVVSQNPLNKPKNSNGVRWVAVPNKPGDSPPDSGPKLQQCTPPVLPINITTMAKEVPQEARSQEPETQTEQPVPKDEVYSHYKISDLRAKQKEQLAYHRKRYSELLQTYNELASKYDEIKDVGTIKQILSDAKKFMKKDHILFFRNEMMLRDRTGTGHRYSPKFMTMLMKYYTRSPIGYRFLRQIFTLPAVRTLINWQNKSLHLKKKTLKSKSSESDHIELTVDSDITNRKLATTSSSASSWNASKMYSMSESEDSSENELDDDEQESDTRNTKPGDVKDPSDTKKPTGHSEIVIEVEEQ